MHCSTARQQNTTAGLVVGTDALLNCCTASLLNCCTAGLLHCWTVAHCFTAALLNCWTAGLLHCSTTAPLPCCTVAPLHCCTSALLNICTDAQQHCTAAEHCSSSCSYARTGRLSQASPRLGLPLRGGRHDMSSFLRMVVNFNPALSIYQFFQFFFLIMARYRLNTTKYVLKWAKKHQKVPKFN